MNQYYKDLISDTESRDSYRYIGLEESSFYYDEEATLLLQDYTVDSEE